MLFLAASQTPGSARIVSYHFQVNDPSGMEGKRSELNEKMILVIIGVNIKQKTSAR
jgi:hypothetical protein